MTSMGVFSGMFCNTEPLLERLAEAKMPRIISDNDVVRHAVKSSGLSENTLWKAFSGRPSLFNRFTYEKERSVAFLRNALCELLPEAPFFVNGFCAHLLPSSVSHILKVCLVCDRRYRAEVAASKGGMEGEEALRRVRQDDEDRAAWV